MNDETKAILLPWRLNKNKKQIKKKKSKLF